MRESLRQTINYIWIQRQAAHVVLNQADLCVHVMVELQACKCALLACYFHVLSVRWQLIVRWLIPHVPLLC